MITLLYTRKKFHNLGLCVDNKIIDFCFIFEMRHAENGSNPSIRK